MLSLFFFQKETCFVDFFFSIFLIVDHFGSIGNAFQSPKGKPSGIHQKVQKFTKTPCKAVS